MSVLQEAEARVMDLLSKGETDDVIDECLEILRAAAEKYKADRDRAMRAVAAPR